MLIESIYDGFYSLIHLKFNKMICSIVLLILHINFSILKGFPSKLAPFDIATSVNKEQSNSLY